MKQCFINEKQAKNKAPIDFEWPVTFNRIATAIAFSPTALAVLNEAIRIAQRFQAEVLFIHVGERNTATENRITHFSIRLNASHLITASCGNKVIRQRPF
jgi:K+-sensing histidine kinase KdpD